MDPKKLFLDHFEKIAIAVAVAILAAFGVGALLKTNPAEAASNHVAEANRRIAAKQELARQNVKPAESPAIAREVQLALEGGPSPEAAPSWLVHKRPVILTKILSDEVVEPRHKEPVTDPTTGVKSDLGRIGLLWQENPLDNAVKIDRYEVYRAEGEPKEGKWKKIGQTEREKTSFTDADVKPKTTYFYQVWSYASVDPTDKNVQRAKERGIDVQLPADQRVTKSAVLGPVKTLPDIYIRLMSVTLKTSLDDIKKGLPREPGTAYIVVWKYFPEKREWRREQYTRVVVGEMIGKDTHATDYKLLETLTVRVKASLGEIEAHAIRIVDEKTGEEQVLNNHEVDQAIQDIEKRPKLDAPEDEGDKKDDKKKPGK